MRRCPLFAVLIAIATPPSLFGQYIVPLDPATARFTFFPGAEGIGVPGGVPNAFELHFGMQGTFTIDEAANQGEITQADFVLVGNEAAFQGNPGDRAFIEENARQILLTAMFTAEHGPPMDRTVFRAEFQGNGSDLVLEFFRQTLVSMDGGPELTAVDGPGYRYTYPIPEPETLVLVLSACSVAALLRSRKHATPVA